MTGQPLDMLQFHWWDYNDELYRDALKALDRLRQNHVIRAVSLTNFDTERLQLIVEVRRPGRFV